MCWSCPFHAFQLPLHVPDIFSVCPLHFPCMSRSFVASHFPTSPVVPIGFLVLCFPFIPPALPLFSFLSLSCPLQFLFFSSLLSCHVDCLFPPLISLHFLAFFLCSPICAAKNTVFPAFSQLGRPKTQSFSRFSAKGGRNPKPAKSRQGESSLGPLFCDTSSPKTTFSGTSSNCLPHVSDVGWGAGHQKVYQFGKAGRVEILNRHQKGIEYQTFPTEMGTPESKSAIEVGWSSLWATPEGLGGGVILYSLLVVRHAEQCRQICFRCYHPQIAKARCPQAQLQRMSLAALLGFLSAQHHKAVVNVAQSPFWA